MSMKRRTLLASAAVALSGCVTGGGGSETDPNQNDEASGAEDEQELEGELLIEDGSALGETSFTVELNASGQLLIGIDVLRRGPAVVTVSDSENESILRKEIAAPGGTIETTVESGTYRVTVADSASRVSIARR
jgi:hypothetical protein